MIFYLRRENDKVVSPWEKKNKKKFGLVNWSHNFQLIYKKAISNVT